MASSSPRAFRHRPSGRVSRCYAGGHNAAGQAAAVDNEQLAVDMVGGVGSEKDRQRTDVVVLSRAAYRNEFAALEKAHHGLVMGKNAGHDTIYLDIEIGVGQRERARELKNRALRARIH